MPESRGTILIVDDEPFIRELLMVRLSKVGFAVIEASNGVEGYERMKATPPDLIICDVMMPREDGITFCRKLRSQGDTTPFIFLTAKDRSSDVVAGLQTGADEYLVKPFDIHELEARIQALLRRMKRPT
jgi:two-component system, OmpR family, response regulator MprA